MAQKRWYVYKVLACNGDSARASEYTDDVHDAIRIAKSYAYSCYTEAMVWREGGKPLLICSYNRDGGRWHAESAAYLVYLDEKGNEIGHYVGASSTLRGAKQIASRALNRYGGDGWGLIINEATGERISHRRRGTSRGIR